MSQWQKKWYYSHSCGEPFYLFKYHTLNAEESKIELFWYVLNAKWHTKSHSIKYHCHSCDIDFYSKILRDNDKEKELPFATWKKYHCKIVINDIMKYPKCTENLFYDKEEDKLICKKYEKNFLLLKYHGIV